MLFVNSFEDIRNFAVKRGANTSQDIAVIANNLVFVIVVDYLIADTRAF